MCGLTLSRKGLLHGVWTYVGRLLFYSVRTYARKLFCTVYGLFQKSIWDGLGLSGSVFVQCMDLPRKDILYRVLTFVGGHYVLYSVPMDGPT
jgi:hypothetical protein